MKWIERLFGKKEQYSPEIRFEELPVWLDAMSEELSQDIGSMTSSLFSEIEQALRKIKKSTAVLEEATAEGRFHLKMVKMATSNRDNMVKQVVMLVENIKIPKSTDPKTIMEFHENAIQTLTICLENMLKSYQYAKLVFLDDSKQVITDVNTLGRLLNQLIEPINENKKSLDAFENAAGAIKAIDKMNSDMGHGKKAIMEIQEKVALLNKEIEKSREALADLLESQQWEQYKDYMKEIDALENRAARFESEINAMVSPLGKALNRLKQLSDSGRYTLAPDIREDLRLCLFDPKRVNQRFFVELEKIIEGDALAIASDKKGKMLEQVRFAKTSFEESKKQYQFLINDIEKKKVELSKMNIVQEEKNLRESGAALQDRLALAEKEFETSKNRLSALEDDIETKKRELQQIVSSIDSKMRVLF